MAAAGLLLPLLAGLGWAHAVVSPGGLEYRGPLLPLDHLFQLAAAVGLLWLCTAAGVGILERTGFRFRGPDETLLFGAAVGSGAVATVLLALGFAGGFGPAPLAGTLALVAVAARRELAAVPGLVRGGLVGSGEGSVEAGAGEGPSGGGRGDRLLAVGTVAVVAAAGLFVLAFGAAPPGDWDTLMYHLEVPRRFLAEGRIHLPADNLHVTRTGLIHLLYVPLLALRCDSAPALLSGLYALLTALAVFVCGRRLMERRTGLLAGALLWGTPTLLLVAVTPRVDVTLALFVFLAHYALVAGALQPGGGRPGPDGRPGQNRTFVLAGLLLGFGVGVKFHALAYAAGLAPVVLWLVLREERAWGARLRLLALAGGAGALVALPWLVKNQVLVGAPFYPLLSAPRLPPWLVPLFGSAALPEAVDPSIARLGWELRAPFNLADAFLAPERITIEGEGVFYYLNPLLALLPLALLRLKDPRVTLLAGPPLLYVAGLLLVSPETNLRYLIPAVVPLTLVTIHVVTAGLTGRFGGGATRAVLALLCVLSLLPASSAVLTYATRTPILDHLAGSVSRLDYMRAHPDPAIRLYGGLLEGASPVLGAGTRTLMLFEARGFHFDSPVVQDNKSTNWPFLVAGRAHRDCLGGLGFTHLLLNHGSLRYRLRGGMDPGDVSWGAFEDFEERCLAPVRSDPSFTLYRVEGSPAGADAP